MPCFRVYVLVTLRDIIALLAPISDVDSVFTLHIRDVDVLCLGAGGY